jgi:hypothetical protein
MASTFRIIDNALGAAAEGYQKTIKQNQQMAIAQADADYQAKQRALQAKLQSYAQSNDARAGAVVADNGTGTSQDAESFARQHGASDAQIQAASSAGVQGWNALYATLAQGQGNQGTPAGGPPPNAQVAAVTPAAAGIPMSDVPTAAPAPKPVDSAPLPPVQPPVAATPVAINPGDPAYVAPAPTTEPTAAPAAAPAGLPTGGAYAGQVIQRESGGSPSATNPLSTASGGGGFVNGTWESLIKKYRPDLAAGKTDAQIDAMKTAPGSNELAGQMVNAYARENSAILDAAKMPVNAATLGMAHLVGPAGAVAVLQAQQQNPTTPLSAVLSPDAMAANPQFGKLTVGDLTQASVKRFGTGTPDLFGGTAGGAPAQPTPQPQSGVQVPISATQAAPTTQPNFSQYVGNAYDTPVGVRVTATPRTRTQGEALTALANKQLELAIMGPDGNLAGVNTMAQAQALRAKEMANEETQRQLDWQKLTKDALNAPDMQSLVDVANKSHLFPGNLTLVQNTKGGNYALEARDANTGVLYTVEQGNIDQIKRDVASQIGDPDKRQAFLDNQQKMINDSVETAARSYNLRKTADAGTLNANVNASEAPSRIASNTAQAGNLNADASLTQAHTQIARLEGGIQQQVADLRQQLASTTDPTTQQQLQTKISNLSGMMGAQISSIPGPNGMQQAHITYPNGVQTVIDPEGQEVPLGQDSRTWAKEPEIAKGQVVYGWHTDPTTGQRQLGFSTAPGILPGGQVAFSSNLRDVQQAMKAAKTAKKSSAAPASPRFQTGAFAGLPVDPAMMR